VERAFGVIYFVIKNSPWVSLGSADTDKVKGIELPLVVIVKLIESPGLIEPESGNTDICKCLYSHFPFNSN